MKEEGLIIPCFWTANAMNIFELASLTNNEAAEQFFLENFPESRDPLSEFFNVMPKLANGKELPGIECFRFNYVVYALAGPSMVRFVLEKLIGSCEQNGVRNLVVVVLKSSNNYANICRVLAYVGFKQVPLDVKREKCFASAVLLELDLVS